MTEDKGCIAIFCISVMAMVHMIAICYDEFILVCYGTKQHVDLFIIILSNSLQSDTKPLNKSGVFFFVYVINEFKLVHAASTILYSCVTRKKSWFVYSYQLGRFAVV